MRCVVFDFADSRGGQHVRGFLGLPGNEQSPGWKGSLVTDDFSGDKACFELGVTEAGCMAHRGASSTSCGPTMAARSASRR